MARAISEGAAAAGLQVKLMSLDEVHRSDVVYELLDAGALVLGSSTLNNQMLPQMGDMLTYLRGLRPANLIGAAFGSYGWSGEAARQIQDVLTEMKVESVGEPIRTKHAPNREILLDCYNLGGTIAGRLKKMIDS
jgi:flavorubredoxin